MDQKSELDPLDLSFIISAADERNQKESICTLYVSVSISVYVSVCILVSQAVHQEGYNCNEKELIVVRGRGKVN